MMSHNGICLLIAPEIEDRAIYNRPWPMIIVDPIRWGALHILDDYRGNIKLIAFMVALII